MGTNVTEMIQSTLTSPQSTVLILGGEPLLMLDKVKEYVEAIRPFKQEIFVTTSLPRILTKRTSDFLQIVELLDGINISLQHHDTKRNNEILAASNKYDRIQFLTELLANDTFAHKARISINLVKGGIDNLDDLNFFLDKLQTAGCRHVKINELQGQPEKYVSYENITKTKMPSPYAFGCQKEIPLREGMKVTLKRSCFMVEDSLAATMPDLLKVSIKTFRKEKQVGPRHGVMYENGMLSEGWITQQQPE